VLLVATDVQFKPCVVLLTACYLLLHLSTDVILYEEIF